MFAKKPPPPEPKLPGLPPVLRISEPRVVLEPPRPDAPEEPLVPYSEKAGHARISQAVIAQAFSEGAEQITLTPDEKGFVVRNLIAGEWRRTMTIPIQAAPGVIVAFKTLAGLPVWEHRMALAGLIVVQYGTVDYDVHLSITPTRYGEKIALRMEAV